jgi:hypothetical protein
MTGNAEKVEMQARETLGSLVEWPGCSGTRRSSARHLTVLSLRGSVLHPPLSYQDLGLFPDVICRPGDTDAMDKALNPEYWTVAFLDLISRCSGERSSNV